MIDRARPVAESGDCPPNEKAPVVRFSSSARSADSSPNRVTTGSASAWRESGSIEARRNEERDMRLLRAKTRCYDAEAKRKPDSL